ncbi:MAG: hypothetical protein GF421_05550 [Candidatus Aminicenantes bacterium]|nr:hypothetical protein [Candidatus Aminicenantes bacterium]
MKKTVRFFIILFIMIPLFTQEQHQVSVINIEVPVRVFKGSRFIDHLKISDFEVYEDGQLQKIETVFLIKKTDIKKQEGQTKYRPEVSRNFVLVFEVADYLPKIGDSIEYFFNEIFLPGDNLTVMTPLKTYHFKKQALNILPKQKIINQLKGKLRSDITLGNSEYKSLLMELHELMPPDEESIRYFHQLLKRLETLRTTKEENLMSFADFLKAKSGPKHVFLFYQKEVLPQLNPNALAQFISMNQDNQAMLIEYYDAVEFYKRDISFDLDRVKKVFSDSSISIHFLFITKPTSLNITRMQHDVLSWADHSEDIYGAFKEMAQATGGITENSANASSSFQKAVSASENYYLIYYKPKDYKPDGTFRRIQVKVKTGRFHVTHRSGYIAD